MSEGKNFFDHLHTEMEANAQRLRSGERMTVTTQQDLDMLYQARYREASIPGKYWPMEMDLWTRQQDARGNDLTPKQAKQKGYAGSLVNFYCRNLPLLCRGRHCWLEKRDQNRGKQFNSMVLMGGKSSGKTLLAAIIAKSAARIGEDVKFYEFGAILETVCSPGYSLEEARQQLLEEFKTMTLVVVDGVEASGSYPAHGERTLRYLATARANTGLPFVLTCTYDMQEAEDHPWDDLLHSETAVRVPLPTTVAKTR